MEGGAVDVELLIVRVVDVAHDGAGRTRKAEQPIGSYCPPSEPAFRLVETPLKVGVVRVTPWKLKSP